MAENLSDQPANYGTEGAAAELDLANPEVSVRQVDVGDAWWDLAKDFTDADKTAAHRRAQYWYRKAAANLNALDKDRVQLRLNELKKLKLDRGPLDEK